MKRHIRNSLLIFAFALAGICSANNAAYAAVSAKTNVNEVTNFFPAELKHRADLDETFRSAQSSARSGIESGSSAKETEQELKLEGGNSSTKASELGSIPAHDLENAGMKARHSDCSFYDENRLEIDYTEPLVVQHKKDVDHILNGCNDFLGNILGGLRDLGIDCKTIAGNREQEPEYNVYTEQVQAQDTTYDQKFCEQPHHTYSCNYTLTGTCIRPETIYVDWKDKQIMIPGRDLIAANKFVFETDKPEDKVFDYVLNLHPRPRRWWMGAAGGMIYPDPYKVLAMREFLVTQHPRATLKNIGLEVEGHPAGRRFELDGTKYCGRRLGSKDYAYDIYIVNYKYSEGKPICHQWQDNWEEGCKVD